MLDITKPITLEDYYALPETHRTVEFIDGAIYVSPEASLIHNIILRRAANVIEQVMPGGLVVGPANVEFSPEKSLEPDVIWIAPDNPGRITRLRFFGTPDLIVEVLSTNADHDRVTKKEIYREFGVPEYWLADQYERVLVVYQLVNQQYEHFGTFERGQTFVSPVLGANIEVSSILDVPDIED